MSVDVPASSVTATGLGVSVSTARTGMAVPSARRVAAKTAVNRMGFRVTCTGRTPLQRCHRPKRPASRALAHLLSRSPRETAKAEAAWGRDGKTSGGIRLALSDRPSRRVAVQAAGVPIPLRSALAATGRLSAAIRWRGNVLRFIDAGSSYLTAESGGIGIGQPHVDGARCCDQRPGSGRLDLDVDDPLDPVETAMIWDDEAARSAVLDGQRDARDTDGEQCPIDVGGSEAGRPAGSRANEHRSGATTRSDGVEDRPQRHAAPRRLERPARRAVEHGRPIDETEVDEIGGRQKGFPPGPVDAQAPGGRIDRRCPFAEERGGWWDASRRQPARTGEPSNTSGYAVGHLCRPEQRDRRDTRPPRRRAGCAVTASDSPGDRMRRGGAGPTAASAAAPGARGPAGSTPGRSRRGSSGRSTSRPRGCVRQRPTQIRRPARRSWPAKGTTPARRSANASLGWPGAAIGAASRRP